MEFMGGGSLAASLAGKPMRAAQAAALVAVLADAVQRAHQQGVIHRDLKPGNILLTVEGTAKIGDFGLAKWFAQPTTSAQQTQVMGTPSYMAPEQAFGPRYALGPAVDVYALGAILYELLTGRPPFPQRQSPGHAPPGRYPGTIVSAPLAAKVPRDLETICLKCLEKEPRRRYGSARALCDDLQQFSAGKAISARAAGPLERAGAGHGTIACWPPPWRWPPRAADLCGPRRLLQPPPGRRAGPHGRRAPASAEDHRPTDQTLTGSVARSAGQRPARVGGHPADHGRDPGKIAGLERGPAGKDPAATCWANSR